MRRGTEGLADFWAFAFESVSGGERTGLERIATSASDPKADIMSLPSRFPVVIV